MNTRQRGMLAGIFAMPPKRNLRWSDVRKVFEALGADVREGEGSRVRVTLHNERATFHAPHPNPTIGVKTVADVKKFLLRAGVTPPDV